MSSNYNLGHNILELYNVLIQTRLTTSKTKRDIQYRKLGIQVASRVAERLTNILGNKKILGKSQIWVEHRLAPSPPSKNQTTALAAKKHAKVYIKLSLPCPVLPDFSIPFQIPRPGL